VMKRIFLMVLLALSACGGKIEDVSSGSGTSGVPGASPTGTGTTVPPSAPSPGQSTPTPPKDPSPASKKVITAQAMPGGRDHLMIFAADEKADTCVRIHLAYPSGSGEYESVLAPPEWGVEDVSRSPGAKRCSPGRQPPAAERAPDAKGTITFGPVATYLYPCTIDVHVSAMFSANPTIEQIDGDKIAVEGCQ
jgi:hypothetical protein